MPQEVGGSGANFGLRERKFEVVLAEATMGLHVGDVVGGVGVEDDGVVEVRDDAFQAFDDLVSMTITNQPGGVLLPYGITSHLQSRSGVQKAVKGMVSLSMVIWWNDETK